MQNFSEFGSTKKDTRRTTGRKSKAGGVMESDARSSDIEAIIDEVIREKKEER